MAIVAYGFDGTINEAQWSMLFADSMAVAPSPDGVATGLSVSPTAGTRTVSVSAGRGVAAGVGFTSDAAITLTFGAAAAGTTRIDNVVAEFNWATNLVTVRVDAGSPAATGSQVAKTPTKTAGNLWQLVLARVTVAAGATTITTANITTTGQVASGWVETTPPAGAWSLAPSLPLAVSKDSYGEVTLSGRLTRLVSPVAMNTAITFSDQAIIPAGFRPTREVITFGVYDVDLVPKQALLRIQPSGLCTMTAIDGGLAANDVIRFHETWKV